MTRYGLIASYTLKKSIGSKIAQQTKGMNKGWSYPSFFEKIYNNPSVLLLYDKIFIDKSQADDLLKRNAKSKMIDSIKSLLESKKFIKFDTESKLIGDDVDLMESYYKLTIKNKLFREEVELLQSKLGNYANPNPLKFEAMNLNVLKILRNKLSSEKKSFITVIDQSCKSELYCKKSLMDVREFIKEKSNQLIAEYIMNNTPKFATNMPFISLNNIDNFLDYWKDSTLEKYRRELNSIATKIEKFAIDKDLTEIKELLPEIKSEVHNRINEANINMAQNVPGKLNLVSGIFGLGGTMAQLANPLIGTIMTGFSGAVLTAKEFFSFNKDKKYDWYKQATKIYS